MPIKKWMIGHRPTDHFFEHLLKETFEFLPDSDVTTHDRDELLNHFNVIDARERFNPDDAVLFNYLNKHGIAFSELKLVHNMISFRIRGTNFDVPSNWSVFKDFKNLKNSHHKNFKIALIKEQDNECLVEVMSSYLGKNLEELSIWFANNRAYFLYMEKSHLDEAEVTDWLNKYFLISEQELKVA